MAAKKILIVDDEPLMVETINFSLTHEGFTCLVAYDGIEAIKKAREEDPDLIILDIMLPKMNGYKVCRLLKFDERYKHIPVIMLTARTQQKDREMGLETGADEYITKPFDMDKLIKLINHYLEKAEKTA